MEETRFVISELVVILETLRQKGVLHRDLKPENLIFDVNWRIKIIDFGTAEVIHNPGVNNELYSKYKSIRQKYKPETSNAAESVLLTTPELSASYKKMLGSARMSNFLVDYEQNFKNRKSFVGTAYYVAPEMLENNDIDFGCDLWSLGIIINKLLTGEYLFNESNDYMIFQSIIKGNYQLNESLHADAKDIIKQLIKRNPRERLGNRPDDSKTDLDVLKQHPFFKGVDWKNSDGWTSPFSKESPEVIRDIESKDFEVKLVSPNRKILLCGIVKKFKFFIVYSKRTLCLYDDKCLEYYHPGKGVFKGSIKLNRGVACSLRNDKSFFVFYQGKEHVFECLDTLPQKWVSLINHAINN